MSTASDTILEMSSVDVQYGFRRAVRGLSLSLLRGGSLGLLGVNGAGKTSCLDVILGVRRIWKGKVRVLGRAPGRMASLKRIGFAPEDGLPPEYLNVREYLKFIAALKGVEWLKRSKSVEELIEWFELPAQKRIGELSKGMRRRLILAQAFVGTPDLLILDEPLNGLDALMILKLRERLQLYLRNGGSLILSSHILSEIEKVCSDVAVLHQGKLLAQSPVPSLVERFGSVEMAFSKLVGGV